MAIDINKMELFVELRSSTQAGQGIDVGDIYVRLDPAGVNLRLVDPAVLSLLGISVSAGASSIGRLAILDATGKFDISFIPIGAGVGDVVGPAGALDHSICLFNGITGKLIKDGVALGAAGLVLKSNGAGLDPSFQADVDVITPVTVTDETATIPLSRRLANGANTTINTGTVGLIKVDVPIFGDVFGPAGATDNSIALFNGVTGKLIKDGVALGAALQVLKSNGAGVPPSFQTDVDVTTPTTVIDETATIPASRRWVNGLNTTVNTGTAGQIKLDVPTPAASATTPITLTNETGPLPLSRQLVAGENTTLNIATAAQIKVVTVVPYTSAAQAIVAGGAIVLAHGLSARPKQVWYELVNVTAELGYTAGQRISFGNFSGKNGTPTSGLTIVPDATNLNIRYSNATPTFRVINFTTGADANITNANWQVVFYAQL